MEKEGYEPLAVLVGLFFVVGFFAGVIYDYNTNLTKKEQLQCQQKTLTIQQLCEQNNDLTRLVNDESALLERFVNTTFIRLNYLTCK